MIDDANVENRNFFFNKSISLKKIIIKYNRSLFFMFIYIEFYLFSLIKMLTIYVHGPRLLTTIFSGGLICRGILSTTQHNVDTFISLSSPLAGQYGGEF